ncbi:methyltransferase domain-containing protein [Streptomyces sp. NPDC000880]
MTRSARKASNLDVGCGTGIAARQFQAVGCRVLGVEPDARMADHEEVPACSAYRSLQRASGTTNGEPRCCTGFGRRGAAEGSTIWRGGLASWRTRIHGA